MSMMQILWEGDSRGLTGVYGFFIENLKLPVRASQLDFGEPPELLNVST